MIRRETIKTSKRPRRDKSRSLSPQPLLIGYSNNQGNATQRKHQKSSETLSHKEEEHIKMCL